MQKMEYVFIDLQTSRENANLIQHLYAIKTNEDFKILSIFKYSQEDMTDTFSKMMSNFEKWVKTPIKCKFVLDDVKKLNVIVDNFNRLGYKPIIKDFNRIFKYQFWNIRNEMAYRLNVTEDFTLEAYLKLYGLHFLGNKESEVDRCYNLVCLATCFKTDIRTNKEVFSQNKLSRQRKNA